MSSAIRGPGGASLWHRRCLCTDPPSPEYPASDEEIGQVQALLEARDMPSEEVFAQGVLSSLARTRTGHFFTKDGQAKAITYDEVRELLGHDLDSSQLQRPTEPEPIGPHEAEVLARARQAAQQIQDETVSPYEGALEFWAASREHGVVPSEMTEVMGMASAWPEATEDERRQLDGEIMEAVAFFLSRTE